MWVELSVLADCAERRDRRVIRGSKQVSDELVPVAVGVEDERDEVGAFLLSKECVLADLLVHGVGFRLVHVGASRVGGGVDDSDIEQEVAAAHVSHADVRPLARVRIQAGGLGGDVVAGFTEQVDKVFFDVVVTFGEKLVDPIVAQMLTAQRV